MNVELQVCLSKGLGAPVGSVIVGSNAFIDKAKILRKTLGGGMRQVGILCAAAYLAVRDTVGKLADDHRKAKVLADGLTKIKQFTVDLASVETNMVSQQVHLLVLKYVAFKYHVYNPGRCILQVFFDIADPRITPDKLCQVLEQRNVLAMPASSKRFNSVRSTAFFSLLSSIVKPSCSV